MYTNLPTPPQIQTLQLSGITTPTHGATLLQGLNPGVPICAQKIIHPGTMRFNQAAASTAAPSEKITENDSTSHSIQESFEGDRYTPSEGRSSAMRGSLREGESSKVRFADLIESLETTGTQMEVLEKQTMELEQEVKRLKTQAIVEKKESLALLVRAGELQYLRTAFSEWNVSIKEERHEAELRRLRKEIHDQRAACDAEVFLRNAVLEREVAAKAQEISRLNDELTLEKEKRTRCAMRNRTMVEVIESLSSHVKRSCDVAKDLLSDDEDDLSRDRAPKDRSVLGTPVQKDTVQVQGRKEVEVPCSPADSVTNVRGLFDRCHSIGERVGLSPRVWKRQTIGFPAAVARSLTPQPLRVRQMMAGI